MPLLLIGLVLVVAGMDNAEGESPLDSPRPFGQGKASRAEEFDRTGVLQPESQITAALRPGILSEFYYLIHHEGKPFTLLVSPCTGPISWTVSYTRPPENEPDAEGARTQWPMTKLVPGSPLFAYAGTEARNFTMMRAQEGLYRFEIRSGTRDTNGTAINRGVDTVLLYATTESPDRLSIVNFGSGKRHRRNLLKFHQRRSKRRLGISWNWSRAGPNLTEYCLAVTSGQLKPPATLCAARNILVLASNGPSDHPDNSGHRSQRSIPEGLHCPRESRLTLNGMRFNTTYHFALFAVSKTNNVSSRVATNSHKFRRTPTQSLRTGHPETVNLLKNSGLAIFQYRPRSNTATVFLMRSCHGGSFRVLLKGPGGIVKDEEVVDGTLKLEAEPLQPGKRYILRISASQKELERVSTVKIIARENVASTYQKTPNRTRTRGNNRFAGGSSWSRSTQRFKIDRRPICSLSDV